jgi:hypothetical protein
MSDLNTKNAEYINHPNSNYRGNPFIEAIGFPLPLDKFKAEVNRPYSCELDLSNIPEEMHGYYRRTAIDELSAAYVVKDEAYRLYDQLLRMIEAGYVRRNPLNPELKKILVAIERDKKVPFQSMHLDALNLVDAKLCTFVAGLSGMGKTTMLKHILRLLTQRIIHTEYVDIKKKVSKLAVIQITYLYIEVFSRKGQKAVLLSLLEALDYVTDQNYQHEYRNSNVAELITVIRKAAIIHGVGIIIIDEAHNLATPSKSEAIAANEKTSMKFIEELFNRIGVPICFVGTMSMLELFSPEVTIGRRSTANGSLILTGDKVDSKFWTSFIKEMCQTKFLANQRTDIGLLTVYIHKLTVGIPAIAMSLIKATLGYLTFLAPKDQDLSLKALDRIFNLQFQILKPGLNALISGKYNKFEDLKPMFLLEEIDTSEDGLAQLAEQTIESNSPLGKEQSKPLQGRVQFSKSKTEQEKLNQKAKIEEPLKTDNLLSSLGYKDNH